MNRNSKEKIIVAVAALLFFAAFGAIAFMDSGHGTDGEGIGANDVNIDVGKNEGHLSIATIPDDLMVFGAGTDAKVDFTVENNDRDNDIDTITVQIPGSSMVNGTSTWYDASAMEHQWNYTGAGDTATFEARDDLMGRVFGGSAQYDVVGNIDDALDHFAVNETIPVEVSEAVTVTAEFTAPSVPGVKYQNQGMQVEVGDLMTEDTPDTMTSLYPDGYPFVVVQDGYSFIIIDVTSTEVDLEVQYGTDTLFSGTTRAFTDECNFEYSDVGMKFECDGHTYAVLEAPEGDVDVKPIIKGKEGATAEDVTVNYQYIEVQDITATGSDLFSLVEDNSTTLPVPASGETYVDTDGDWIFDVNDPDDDNDGIPDERDENPLVKGDDWINTDPTINTVTGPEEKVEVETEFQLTVDASDEDGDPLEYEWSVTGSDWTGTGATVAGPTTLEPGTYTFTVTVSDDKGGVNTGSVEVEIYEEDEPSGGWVIYAIIGAILLVIVIVVIFFLMRGKEEEEEMPEEMPPQEPVGGYEEPEPDYEDVGEDQMDEDIFGESSMEPPQPMEEPVSEETAEPTEPSIGTVPSEEEEEEETPTLPGEEGSPEVEDLESLIDEMEKTEEEVGDVCPECNSPLGPYDSECPNCGAQFEVALECPNCGAVVEDNVSECPNCGVSFM